MNTCQRAADGAAPPPGRAGRRPPVAPPPPGGILQAVGKHHRSGTGPVTPLKLLLADDLVPIAEELCSLLGVPFSVVSAAPAWDGARAPDRPDRSAPAPRPGVRGCGRAAGTSVALVRRRLDRTLPRRARRGRRRVGPPERVGGSPSGNAWGTRGSDRRWASSCARCREPEAWSRQRRRQGTLKPPWSAARPPGAALHRCARRSTREPREDQRGENPRPSRRPAAAARRR